jgi:hypothetical protein
MIKFSKSPGFLSIVLVLSIVIALVFGISFFLKSLPSPFKIIFSLIVVFLMVQLFVKKTVPDVQDLVKLISYGITIYFMVALYPKAIDMCIRDVNEAVGMLTGIIVTLYVSFVGIINIFALPISKKQENFKIKKNSQLKDK